MYQEAVMVPVGDWAQDRLSHLGETDKIRDESKVQSGFGKNISNWLGRDKVYPDNVLHLATECSNRNHSAAFPTDLPTWFVKLFTEEGDIVLDPFVGSGTELIAGVQYGMDCVGFETSREYFDLACKRISDTLGQQEASSQLEFAEW